MPFHCLLAPFSLMESQLINRMLSSRAWQLLFSYCIQDFLIVFVFQQFNSDVWLSLCFSNLGLFFSTFSMYSRIITSISSSAFSLFSLSGPPLQACWYPLYCPKDHCGFVHFCSTYFSVFFKRVISFNFLQIYGFYFPVISHLFWNPFFILFITFLNSNFHLILFIVYIFLLSSLFSVGIAFFFNSFKIVFFNSLCILVMDVST